LRFLAVAILALAALSLPGQETPANNRSVWFAIFPEPMPEAVNAVALEGSSQFLRTGQESNPAQNAFARLDGEDWQLTGDLAWAAGPGRFNVRIRGVLRSGGVSDQAIYSYHAVLGFPQGGRNLVPKDQLDDRLIYEGTTVACLQRPGSHLMDTDIAYVIPLGDRHDGGRLGATLKLPTGDARNWSGDGSTDGVLGAAAWKSRGRWRVHGQVERVFLGTSAGSPFEPVLAHHGLFRLWLGCGWEADGPGFWRGLGLDVTLQYHESPYRVGIPLIDKPGFQQHWTFAHRSLPKWRFGFSEDMGLFNEPDITAFVVYRP
jgi:hypothetical protein